MRAAACILVGLMALAVMQFVAGRLPPIQSPDEISHLVRIAALSEGRLRTPTPPDASTGMEVDVGFGAVLVPHLGLAKDRQHQPAEQALQQMRTQGWTGRTALAEAPGAAMYPPLVYLPAAAGMAVARWAGGSVMQSYSAARLGSHLACAVMLAVAAWLWTPPALAWIILLLPMSLFQMAAPVVDGPAHALTLLVLSLFMRLRLSPKPHRAGLWVWCALLAVLVSTRLHLAPLLLLPFWLAGRPVWRQLAAGRNWWPAAWAAAACGAWVLWVMGTVKDTRVQRSLSTAEVLVHYARHPSEAWDAMVRTLSDGPRLNFLHESFIGILGWLDTRLPDEAYVALSGILLAGVALAVLAGLIAARGGRDGRDRPATAAAWTVADRALLLGMAAASVLLAFLLMLLTWTPFPPQLIEGVQGRYFVAPALVAAYAVGATDRGVRFAGVAGLLLVTVAAVSGLVWLDEILTLRYPPWSRPGWGW